MVAHLIKSKEVNKEKFTNVVGLLKSVSGQLQFVYKESSIIDFDEDEESQDGKGAIQSPKYDPFSKDKDIELLPYKSRDGRLKWTDIFNKCNEYRAQNYVYHNEFVIILTDIPNENNWFATFEDNNPYNCFIHTDEWERYINCSPEFPIAYYVIALMMYKSIFNGSRNLREDSHRISTGCMSDFCGHKKEIILKLRTADICPDCLEKLRKDLPPNIITHALDIMESLRIKMLYAQSFRQYAQLSRLDITKDYRIFLPGFANVEIKLYPLEKVLYILFLQHPEGIYMSSLCEHKVYLKDLYNKISNNGDIIKREKRIDDLVNVLNDSANEKISRIKKEFENKIGKDLAENYYISGERGSVKKITLDRKLVTIIK